MAKLSPLSKKQSKVLNGVSIFLSICVVSIALVFGIFKIVEHTILDNIAHPSIKVVDKHATTAATVMQRNYFNLERPTNEAAYDVVGDLGGTKIEALKATGTSYDGDVPLKISVTGVSQGPLGTDDPIERCYSYHFTHDSSADLKPKRLKKCPSDKPVEVFAAPRLPIDSQALLQSILDNLSPNQRTDSVAIKSIILAKFPSRTKAVVYGSAKRGYSVSIRAGYIQCLSGTIPPTGSPVANRVITGTDCLGG